MGKSETLIGDSVFSQIGPPSRLTTQKPLKRTLHEDLILLRAEIAEQEQELLEILRTKKIVSRAKTKRVYTKKRVIEKIIDVLSNGGVYSMRDIPEATVGLNSKLERLVVAWKALEITSDVAFDKNRTKDFIKSLKTL
jgi:hypothetical protein